MNVAAPPLERWRRISASSQRRLAAWNAMNPVAPAPPKSWRLPGRAACLLVAALALPFACHSASAQDTRFEARVTRVVDGDSLWVAAKPSGAPVELRLLGIDAPEICQAWGAQSRAALEELVMNKGVVVHTQGHDTHGRTLGTVYVGALNVNKAQVQEGHAWSTRYKFDRGPYVADERMARALSRGLNRDGGALMPRDFRQLHGPCVAGETAAPVAAASATPPERGAAPAAVPSKAGSAPAAPVAKAAAAAVSPPSIDGFQCDGRNRCRQMTSCAEAMWFMKNCPGVQMDGNSDGIPCERQWCAAQGDAARR
jgi:micrococcal nuclease